MHLPQQQHCAVLPPSLGAMSSPAVQGSKEPLRIVNNSVYEPQHVHTNGPTVHPPPVSLLSMTSNMGDSSFMASTAGDEYACELLGLHNALHWPPLPTVPRYTLSSNAQSLRR